MLDLKKRKPGVRAYVRDLEQWLIETLALFGVKGERRGRPGLESGRRAARKEDKISPHWGRAHPPSLGELSWRVAECRTGSFPELGGIVPCGVSQHGITSLSDLGVMVTMA